MKTPKAELVMLGGAKSEKRGFYGFAGLAAFDQGNCTRAQQPMKLPENFTL